MTLPYKKVCVCVCVCVCVYVCCVCVSVCVCACLIQNVSKINNLFSLERAAGGHQKATESKIRMHIDNTLKI